MVVSPIRLIEFSRFDSWSLPWPILLAACLLGCSDDVSSRVSVTSRLVEQQDRPQSSVDEKPKSPRLLRPPTSRRLTQSRLTSSVTAGREYLLNQQTAMGTFRYQVNFLTGQAADDDNEIRQAGALWGLALIHQADPSEITGMAIMRGVKRFRAWSRRAEDGGKFINYPHASDGKTGTVALVSLALIELLRCEESVDDQALEQQRREYFQFLQSLRLPDGRFSSRYDLTTGISFARPSPYADGETLLAMIKSARYLDHRAMRMVALQSAETMYQKYFVEAQQANPDSPHSKAFYQWGSLSFLELYDSGWPGTEQFAERTIEMGHWMLDTHRVLERKANTAYAFEGLICAWELARRTKDRASQEKFFRAIQQGMLKLMTWQVGNPLQNEFLRKSENFKQECRGGVLGSAKDPWLRIDTTQHQMHAVLLARRYLFPQ